MLNQVRKNPLAKGILFLMILIAHSSCDFRRGQLSEKPVIQVNEQQLTAKDFSNKLARDLKKFDAISAKDPANVSRIKNEIIQDFIIECLISEYAKESKIEVSDIELQAELNNFRSSYPDDISFRRVLAEENLSISEWKEELRKSILAKKVFHKISGELINASDSEITRYYQDNKERFKKKEQVYLRQIILDEISKAEAIKDELKQKDFADLARKYSVAPEAKSGGLIGWIEKGSIDIFDKAFDLKVGGISPILESPYGFHIFKVEKRIPAGYSDPSSVKKLIQSLIQGQKQQAIFSSWLDKQIRRSRVFKDSNLISGIKVETKR